MKYWAHEFYLSAQWRATRDAYAASVGRLCEDCLGRGLYVPGKIVHHVTPLTPENVKDPTVALSWENLRLVCRDCHAAEHRRNDGKRYRIMSDGTVAPKP